MLLQYEGGSGCIDTLGWAELIANWPGEGRSRPGRETRVSLQCFCMVDMEPWNQQTLSRA